MDEQQIVIAIGREYGSGGHEVGVRLANLLNIPLYDKALTELISKDTDFAEQFLNENEEKVNTFSLPAMVGHTLSPTYQQSFSDQIFLEQSKLIRQLAQKSSCIIIGRCADHILRDLPNVCLVHVFVHGDLEKRIQRKLNLLYENENRRMEYSDMKKHIKQVDKQRSAYYSYYTDKKWGDRRSYDLCLSTDHIGIDGVVKTIATYIEALKDAKEN